MKKIIAVLSFFMLLFTMDSMGGEPQNTPSTIPIKKQKESVKYPKSPGVYIGTIHAYIDGDCISITFDEPEGMAEILIKDELSDVCASAIGSTDAEITISAPMTVGLYSLEISTSLGNKYIGFFSAE